MWVTTCVHEKRVWALGFLALGNRGGLDERKIHVGRFEEGVGEGDEWEQRKKKKEKMVLGVDI